MKHIKLIREYFDEGWKKFSDDDNLIQSEEEVADEVADEIVDDEIVDDEIVDDEIVDDEIQYDADKFSEEYLKSPLPDDLDEQFEEFKNAVDALRNIKNKYNIGRGFNPIYSNLLKKWHIKYKEVIDRDNRSDEEKYGKKLPKNFKK